MSTEDEPPFKVGDQVIRILPWHLTTRLVTVTAVKRFPSGWYVRFNSGPDASWFQPEWFKLATPDTLLEYLNGDFE